MNEIFHWFYFLSLALLGDREEQTAKVKQYGDTTVLDNFFFIERMNSGGYKDRKKRWKKRKNEDSKTNVSANLL